VTDLASGFPHDS